MKASEVKVDLEELKEFKRKNARERLWFIDFLVEYTKKHSKVFREDISRGEEVEG